MRPLLLNRAVPAVLALALLTPAWLLLDAGPALAQQGGVASPVALVDPLPAGPVYADGSTPVTLHVIVLNPDYSPLVGLKPKLTASQLVVQPLQASAAYADWVRQETQGTW